MQADGSLNFKMPKEGFSCPYFEKCSLRLELPSEESCYGESVEKCIRYRANKIREEMAQRISKRNERKRNIVGILTGNV